ncbi:MAG: ABC transporter ATP-binding protein [Candidatus Heimdallarchaeota archaeon]|nr:MAG: ABC transporter ATP-binding protein [Candidatus Heimdallarchaeota archaeon]
MAWHLAGALFGDNYDKQYSEREIVSRLLPYLLNHKLYLALVIVFSILAALISLIAPVTLAFGLDELFKPLEDQRYDFILLMTVGYLVLLGVEWILSYISSVNSQKMQALVTYDLRSSLFSRINKHEIAFFDQNKTGKIMSRVSGDTFQLGTILTTLLDLGSVIVRAALILTTMLLIDWQLTILSMVIFPILFVVIYALRKLFRRSMLLQMRAESTLNAFVEEQVSGIQITKSFGQEEKILDSFSKLQTQKVSVNIKQGTLFRSVGPFFDFITALGLFVLLVGGGNAVITGSLTPALLFLFITYLRQLFQPLIALSTFYATLQGGFAAGERIFSLMDVPIGIRPGKIPCPPLQGEITFENVSFAYDDQNPIFEDFNLHIPAGQTLAIVGETGAGKTSLTSLLARFYEYNSGEIVLDQKYCLKDINADSLRDQLGYVLQEPFLFSGTIRENLLLGSPNASEDELKWAIHAVNADSFIKLLPKGLDTPIQERGRGLSQGQKQLLSLARILLKDPRILMLDEATASVDAYTEHMIQEALHTVFQSRTTIVIAHRLSTILNADRIIVMDHGKILDEGTHEELISRKGPYRDLYYTYYAHQGALEELQIKKVVEIKAVH